MKKQIIIENCFKCPYVHFIASYRCTHPKCPVILYETPFINENGEIPDWCPLEDANNDETHYMVPKPFLRVIYSTISGIITKKELDDSLSEADDVLWMIREKIKNITGHGD